MPSASTDALYLTYLGDHADILLRDARARKDTLPSLWLWGELDDAVAAYIKAVEDKCNGPRSKAGEHDTKMGLVEDKAFSLLLALAIEQDKISADDGDARLTFLRRILLVREDEKSLEDLVWDERQILWKK